MILLEDKTAEEILGSIKIPPQPEVLLKIYRELEKKEPSMDVFTDIIGSDVSISSAVLRIINSPFYGMRSEINSIHHAISLLGLIHIKEPFDDYPFSYGDGGRRFHTDATLLG